MDEKDLKFFRNFLFDFSLNKRKSYKKTVTKILLETKKDILEGNFAWYPNSRKGCAFIVMRPINSELTEKELEIWENVTEKEAWKLIKKWVRQAK